MPTLLPSRVTIGETKMMSKYWGKNDSYDLSVTKCYLITYWNLNVHIENFTLI